MLALPAQQTALLSLPSAATPAISALPLLLPLRPPQLPASVLARRSPPPLSPHLSTPLTRPLRRSLSCPQLSKTLLPPLTPTLGSWPSPALAGNRRSPVFETGTLTSLVPATPPPPPTAPAAFWGRRGSIGPKTATCKWSPVVESASRARKGAEKKERERPHGAHRIAVLLNHS